MKCNCWILRTLLFVSLIFYSAGSTGQDPLSSLETTRKIADKILNETEFGYRLVPLSYNGGIIQFSTREDGAEDGSEVHCARSKMNPEEETPGLLGLSFKGRIKLFLNGREIYAGTSDSVRLREYTYNRYDFHHKIPVEWKKGGE